MTNIRLEKLRELRNIITDRTNNPGINPDFDGIFSLLMKNKYIIEDKGNWAPPAQRQTEQEKKKNAIGKFTNYAYYGLMSEPDDVNKFDSALTKRMKEEAYGIRMNLERNWKEIREHCGHAIPEFGDTSERDWYVAQDKIVNSIMLNYGTISG